jgi:hypothetical protein
MTHVYILSRDLNIVEFCMMEIDEVAAALVQRLAWRPGVQSPLVAIPPVLETANVLS